MFREIYEYVCAQTWIYEHAFQLSTLHCSSKELKAMPKVGKILVLETLSGCLGTDKFFKTYFTWFQVRLNTWAYWKLFCIMKKDNANNLRKDLHQD